MQAEHSGSGRVAANRVGRPLSEGAVAAGSGGMHRLLMLLS